MRRNTSLGMMVLCALSSVSVLIPGAAFAQGGDPEINETILRRGLNQYDGVSDVHISSNASTHVPETTGNFGASTQLRVSENGRRQTLIRFELTGVPPLAVIDEANLVLNIESINYVDRPQLAAHPLTQPWAEGTCLHQYSCVADGATYFSRGGGNGDWTSPGGDFGARITVVDAPLNGSVSIPLTGQVQSWLNGSADNYGVLLKGERQWSNDFRISSSEAESEALRPQLVVRWHLPEGVTDGDGDGFDPPQDCDDSVAAINPGNAEIPGNGIDDDCDASTRDSLDFDQDGFEFPADCDDDNAAVNPGATEILLNGIDDDCNILTVDARDLDGDGFDESVDCNDTDASVNPGASEVLRNNID
ncbi:MAG: MopE-related protein, partial [Bradymonadia bacterium]